MKKTLSVFFALTLSLLLFIPSYATSIDDESYNLVDGKYLIPVTEEQFNEFNENTDLEEFIEKYSLVRIPAVIEEAPEAPTVNINDKSRASVNIPAREIDRNGVYYNDSNGDPFVIKKGGTFKITAKISRPKYPGAFIGYRDHSDNLLHGMIGGSSSRSESFKFTKQATVDGYIRAEGGPIQLDSGKITWTKGN